jgi:hypothetical protein
MAKQTKTVTWVSWVLSGLPCLMLGLSAGMKFVQPAGFVQAMEHMGIPLGQAVGLGVLEVACTVLYLAPRTAVLGAILLTGYMGGAIEAHVRVGDPFVVQFLLGVMLWGGLYLREERLQELMPWVKPGRGE